MEKEPSAIIINKSLKWSNKILFNLTVLGIKITEHIKLTASKTRTVVPCTVLKGMSVYTEIVISKKFHCLLMWVSLLCVDISKTVKK